MNQKKLTMTSQAASGAWHALTNRIVKGRVDSRKHSKLSAELRSKLTTPADKPEFSFKAGVIELAEDVFQYLVELVDERLRAGVPGNYGAGYGELVEAIEPHEEKAETAETK